MTEKQGTEMQSSEPKTQDQISQEARAQAAADAQAKEKALAKAAADRAQSKGVKVKGLVNMLCKDGARLVPGKVAHLSQAEYDRLKAEKRFANKPAFEDIPKAGK